MSKINPIALIGKAIREGKYLKINYENKNGDNTQFWISILDINANDELFVHLFNPNKDEPILNAKIFISKIQDAEILKFSHYKVSEKLIRKLDEDKSLDTYDFDRFDNNVLNYYLECYKANSDPFLYRQHLIQNLEIKELIEKVPYQLSDIQQKQILKEIYHNQYKVYNNYELAICEFSIDLQSRGKFVVAYRKLTFDPVEKTLQIGTKLYFNSNFYIENIKYSLSYYTDMSPTDFEALYLEDKNAAIELLRSNFKSGELPNTRPEIVVLGYTQIDISSIYDEINSQHSKKEMNPPLRAFFQNFSLLDRKNRKEPHIVLYDNNINIDQLRTIYNSLKFPITYVQGPPGTGKTQTILNIVVNCLTNNKTLLISSNNNIPIDGIKDKLFLGKYKNKEILFPIIRLGNNKLVAKALKRIKELYEFETRDIPKEKLLFNLKEKSKVKNQILLEKLKNYEDRIDLEQNLGFVTSLLSKGSYYLLEQEKDKLESRLNEIPQTTDDNIKGIFEVIKDNYQLLQFFYFECLRYMKRLKTKKYSDLIEILYLEEEDEQIKKFNNWIADDENLERFTKVFPIVLTTNISCRRLGRKFKFDLLAIDEAGQCDIATSLIPISKCTNMVLIGDTNQLKPIVIFEETRNEQLMKKFQVDEVYDYFNNSILSVYKNIDNISRNILLSYHYRCGKKIINYSNMRFYESRLNLEAIKTQGEIKLIDVNNVNHKNRNSQIEEAKAIVDYIKDNNLKDVFIITPFRNQEEVINHYLKVAKDKKEIAASVSCGTIHKVQGQENKTIIISTAISKNTSSKTYDWIKNNSQLINVGVTRAKENLIVVTDMKAIDIISKKDDDLYALIDYVAKNGTTSVSQSVVNKFTIGFSNDSSFENEFYLTMNHYCSIRGSKFRRNVKIIDLFPEEKNNELVNKKEFDGVLYEGNIPKIVFELNGREHYSRKSTIKSDKIKMELLKAKGIKLLFIPNQYVKHYEFIKELINKFKGDIYQKTLFDNYDSTSS
ncbi:AAA domain-containing protein [uncultured Kordia sp.]|uniref:DEAD/DEAH box helicase n=1 Tax=uncultured Kordia sp. TaxID=507699 RepID=UPI002634035C|nr:AAA domain-containing protein [uncultured Kordia sp.]